MTCTVFNQKFDNGVNEALSYFAINPMVSFQDKRLHITCFAISLIFHIQLSLKFTISTWCFLLSDIDETISVLRNMLLKIAS